MDPKLDAQLCKDFPEIFKTRCDDCDNAGKDKKHGNITGSDGETPEVRNEGSRVGS